MQIFGIVGWKNNGKTGLVVRLVEHLTAQGLKVSTIKHAHHDCDVDQPGKDSFRHREAGATEVLLTTSQRWMLVHELRGDDEPPLEALLAKLAPVDLVLVEGFKHHPHAKLEVHRAERATPLLAMADPTIVAVAADVELPGLPVPCLHLDDTAAIAALILARRG